MNQQFGGPWTEKKLQALEDYLNAYMTIMKGNRAAQSFRTTYLDGFAGSGRRHATESDQSGQLLLESFSEPDTMDFYRGSARRALELEKPFDEYIFVDIAAECTKELEPLLSEFPNRSIRIVCKDANHFIPRWCNELERNDRALVFLDPYGMQVAWKTIEALAHTQKVDLWVLVPLGQAIARVLPQHPPPLEWARALTKFFGTDDWEQHFYVLEEQLTLFGVEEVQQRVFSYERATEYIVKRLRTVFAGVLDTPVVLTNSKDNPLYLLCFAASNPKGADPAIRIARDIARKFNDGS